MKKISIFMIDNDHKEILIIKDLLAEQQEMFYDFNCTNTHSSGIRQLKECRYDIVLINMNISGQYKGETVEYVRLLLPELPIVILTADSNEYLAMDLIKKGAQEYLVKGDFTGQLLWKSIIYSIERHALLTKLINAQEMEKHIAYHDSLTGVANRVLFFERIEHGIKQAVRNKKKLCVIYIDIDDFKSINDKFGHHSGDIFLKSVADCLSSQVRDTDTVARFGGDEFVILLNDISDMSHVENIGNKILKALSANIVKINDQGINISVSMGAAIYPDHAYLIDELITKADEAMYKSKNNGKNKFKIHKANNE